MSRPYRVVVWDPGGLGSVAIWELHRLPEFELAGVRAYTSAKHGTDAGDLLGIGPVGVLATADPNEAIAIDCDCVLYTPRDMGNHNTDAELLQLLSAGRNVVTPLPYQCAHRLREPEFLAALDRACRDGGATFHATGIDPDAISDRVVLGLTSMCTDISRLRLREQWEVDAVEPDLLALTGFGQPPGEAEAGQVATAISTHFLNAIGRSLAEALGVQLDRVEESHLYVPADHDIVSRNITVKAGTVGRVTHLFQAWSAAKGAQPFLTVELNWFVSHDMLPEGAHPGEYWIIEIEGVPSMRTAIDLRASLDTDARFYEIGSLRTEPGYHGTIAPCLQAIPLVTAAEPGVVGAFHPPVHWRQDLRQLLPTTTS
jgi:2,4-diaminopentanoate dehydrogenase